MAWISFAIVVVLFYLPGNLSGLGQEIIRQDITLPLSAVLSALPFQIPIPPAFADFPLPGTGVIRLFISSVGLWAALCLILGVLFQPVFRWTPNHKWDMFRSGLLYARQPNLCNNLAVVLAGYVVARAVTIFALQFLKSLVTMLALGSLLVDGASFLVSFLDNLLPPSPDPRLTVLCWFTLVVVSGFRPAEVLFRWGVPQTAFTMTLVYGFAGEQRQRHKDQIQQNLLERKKEKQKSGELVLPMMQPDRS